MSSSIKGWFISGRAPDDFFVSKEPSERRPNGTTATFCSKNATPRDFGALMQQFVPGGYRGTRVRLAAWIKTEVRDWCGMFMRVDGVGNKPISFDNMESRPIKGSTPWTHYEIVLDVPPDAQVIAFGIAMHGAGVAWLDEVTLTTVGDDVATTAMDMPEEPQNLLFDD